MAEGSLFQGLRRKSSLISSPRLEGYVFWIVSLEMPRRARTRTIVSSIRLAGQEAPAVMPIVASSLSKPKRTFGADVSSPFSMSK